MSEHHRWFNVPGFLYEGKELAARPQTANDNKAEFSEF